MLLTGVQKLGNYSAIILRGIPHHCAGKIVLHLHQITSWAGVTGVANTQADRRAKEMKRNQKREGTRERARARTREREREKELIRLQEYGSAVLHRGPVQNTRLAPSRQPLACFPWAVGGALRLWRDACNVYVRALLKDTCPGINNLDQQNPNAKPIDAQKTT